MADGMHSVHHSIGLPATHIAQCLDHTLTASIRYLFVGFGVHLVGVDELVGSIYTADQVEDHLQKQQRVRIELQRPLTQKLSVVSCTTTDDLTATSCC